MLDAGPLALVDGAEPGGGKGPVPAVAVALVDDVDGGVDEVVEVDTAVLVRRGRVVVGSGTAGT